MDKLIPMIQNVGSQALGQFSAKIRPNKKYKTSLQDKIAYFASTPLAGPAPTFTTAFNKLGSQALKGITDNINHYGGDAVDLHKMIGSGWTLPGHKYTGHKYTGHKYTGPYNDLDSQVKYDPKTEEKLEM